MFCMFASLSVLFEFGTWGQNGQSPQFTISRKWKQSEAIAKKKNFFSYSSLALRDRLRSFESLRNNACSAGDFKSASCLLFDLEKLNVLKCREGLYNRIFIVITVHSVSVRSPSNFMCGKRVSARCVFSNPD